jgi:hypothetical protein
MPVCVEINPEPVVTGPGHSAACHLLIPDALAGRDAGREALV